MGGGVMRTAAKSAAFAGYRAVAARRSHLPPSTAASTVHVATESESTPLISSLTSENAGVPAVGPVQFPAWEIDDWEFADADLPGPRLVFGLAPTLEEAREATSDLKEAIEKVYFSSSPAEESVKVSQVSELGGSAAILPAMPKHVVQAFSLLRGSSEAQDVVASLAADESVWDAVMKNEKVMDFYIKHQSILLPPETNTAPEESTGENLSPKESSETVESPNNETSEGSGFFTDLVQNIKFKVSEVVSNISDFLQDFFGTSNESRGQTETKAGTSTSDKYVDPALGASFIALAVAAILVVLVKRG